jgi:aspartate kinase
MVVLKFGGTSVADADAIARLVSIVRARGGPRTVVVSALAGVTDGLLGIADVAVRDAPRAHDSLAAITRRHHEVAAALSDANRRERLDADIDGLARGVARNIHAIAAASVAVPAVVDRLVAVGELWSSRIVAAFLADDGVASHWIDARTVIRTDGTHRSASPDFAATEAAIVRLVRPALALDRVVVIAGFVGSGPAGDTTTLGRGGSDYSAAIVGACLHADEIEIWTDVDGVLSADPRVVADARVLPALSYEDAQALATFGAKVLHPKTIEPAAARGIPVVVRNSRRPAEPGTRIDAYGAGDGRVAAVTSRAGVSLVDIASRGSGAPGSFAALAFQSLADAGVSVVIGEFSDDRLTVVVDQTFDLEGFRARVAPFADVRIRAGLAAVCAVGDRLTSEPHLMSGAFAVFNDASVHLVSRRHGRTAFAVIVDDRDVHDLVARLHDHLSPSHGTHGTQGSHGTHGTDGTEGSHGTHGTHGTEGSHGTHRTHGTEGSHGTHRTHGTEGSHGTHGIHGINRSGEEAAIR